MIEVLDNTNVWNKRGKPAVVNIDADGRVSFSVEAVKQLKLKEGMRIAFRIDHRDKGIIYFYEQATGIPLKASAETKSGIRLSIYCRPLAQKLLSFFGFRENKSFDIDSNTVKFHSCPMWFILKEKVHKPVQWRKQK